jgi:prepilin-type N-terminal cleavage/methylation domain-containing protein
MCGKAHTARASHGFTLIEILVAIGVVALLAVITVATFVNINQHVALQSGVHDIETALLNAKQRTLAARNDMVSGVHIESDRVVEFGGTAYNSGDPANIVYLFPAYVTASTTLAGGGNDVIFTRLSGSANTSGTITVTESRTGETRTIRIYASGLIERE